MQYWVVIDPLIENRVSLEEHSTSSSVYKRERLLNAKAVDTYLKNNYMEATRFGL